MANAEGQSDVPLVSAPESSTPSTQAADSTVFHLNDQEMEKILKTGEVALRKIKTINRKQEQKKHVQNTEKYYQEAISFYHQKRPVRARAVLVKVQDSMADYKSANKVLRIIDNRAIAKLKVQMRKIRQIEEVPLVSNLTQKAVDLYQKTADLGDDQEIITLRKKIVQVANVLDDLKHQKEKNAKRLKAEIKAQDQIDQIAKQADQYDGQVADLVKSGDYKAARAKYFEFQAAMADNLRHTKQFLVNKIGTDRWSLRKSVEFDENDYRRLEKNFFGQAVELYKTKNYEAARIIFNELASQGNMRARAYLRKTDRLLEEEFVKKERAEKLKWAKFL